MDQPLQGQLVHIEEAAVAGQDFLQVGQVAAGAVVDGNAAIAQQFDVGGAAGGVDQGFQARQIVDRLDDGRVFHGGGQALAYEIQGLGNRGGDFPARVGGEQGAGNVVDAEAHALLDHQQ